MNKNQLPKGFLQYKIKSIYYVFLGIMTIATLVVFLVYQSFFADFLTSYFQQKQISHLELIKDEVSSINLDNMNVEEVRSKYLTIEALLERFKDIDSEGRGKLPNGLELNLKVKFKIFNQILNDDNEFSESKVLKLSQNLIEIDEFLQKIILDKSKTIGILFERTYEKRFYPFAVGFFFILILGVTLFFTILKIEKEFITSIKEMIRFSDSLGEGNLNERLNLQTENEFGIISKAFNDTMVRLNNLLVSKEQLEVINMELTQINKELENFTYISSHDLREPLRAIATYSDIIIEDYPDINIEAKKDIRSINKLANRAQSQIDSIMEYNKAQQLDYTFTKIDTNQVILSVLDDLKLFMKEHNATLRAEKLPELYGDKIRIKSVLYNIILNGIKYNESSEKIITIAPGAVPLTIEIKDNGIGIPAEYGDTIFEFFKRLHSKDSYGGGSGAGLSIVKRILDRHNWTIKHTNNVDGGSCFTIHYIEAINDK